MRKINLLIAAIILIASNLIHAQESMPCTVCPDANINPAMRNLKIYFDGYNNYRSNTLYIYSIDINGITQSHQFATPGSWTFSCPITQSFGNIKEELRNTALNNNYFYATTTYSNYFNNSMQIGEITKHWFDTWNGKSWFYCSQKTATNEWHFWIGN